MATPLLIIQSKLPPDQLAKGILDFLMAWDRCSSSRLRVCIYVMVGTVMLEVTTRLDQLTKKLAAFHTATSISLLCMPS